MKRIVMMILTLWICACNAPEQDISEPASMAKNTSEVKKMIDVFDKQEHRIELNDCELLYNDKAFELGMSVRQLIGVFGPYDYFNRGYYVWEKAGVTFVEKIAEKENLEDKLGILKIFLHTDVDFSKFPNLKHESSINENIFLINGIPLDNKTTVQDLIDRSQYDYQDFQISSRSYEMTTECIRTGIKLDYYFAASGGWNYGGGGHLQYKTNINRNNDNVITRVSLQLAGKE